MKICLLAAFILVGCQDKSSVVDDKYVLVEFAAKLEEHNLAEKPQLHTINEVKGAGHEQSQRNRL